MGRNSSHNMTETVKVKKEEKKSKAITLLSYRIITFSSVLLNLKMYTSELRFSKIRKMVNL